MSKTLRETREDSLATIARDDPPTDDPPADDPPVDYITHSAIGHCRCDCCQGSAKKCTGRHYEIIIFYGPVLQLTGSNKSGTAIVIFVFDHNGEIE